MTTDPMSRSPESGFTLLELMTVFGVIAVLSGIGIGFLSRSDNDMEVAMAVIRDKVRLAYETARTTGRPTSVELVKRKDSDQQVVAMELRAKVLAPVAQWHLEPGERAFQGLEADITGVHEANGRYGGGMRPDTETASTMLAIHTKDHPSFTLRDGFALRVEVFMEAREKCIVAQLGPTFSLELDQDLRPMASLTLADGPRRGPTVTIETSDSELPLRRWVSLALVHDGRLLRLYVDGEEAGAKSAMGEPFQSRQGDLFEVSPNGSLVPGILDEIQLLAYDRDEPAELPAMIEIKGLEKPLVYDRRGRLTRPVTIELALEDDKRRVTVAPGGVLQ